MDPTTLEAWLVREIAKASDAQTSASEADRVFLAGQKQALARVLLRLRKRAA